MSDDIDVLWVTVQDMQTEIDTHKERIEALEDMCKSRDRLITYIEAGEDDPPEDSDD